MGLGLGREEWERLEPVTAVVCGLFPGCFQVRSIHSSHGPKEAGIPAVPILQSSKVRPVSPEQEDP